MEPQVKKVIEILHRYTVQPLTFKVEDVAIAIYRSDSEVWKMYLKKKTDAEHLRDFAAAVAERDFFSSLASYIREPDRVIMICFALLTELLSLIDRYEITGVYSEQQAMGLCATVLCHFAEAVFPNQEYKAAYWRNKAAVRLYNRYWMPYEKYMVKNGHWEAQGRNNKPLNKMSVKELINGLQNDPKMTEPEKTDKQGNGCFEYGLIIIAIILIGLLFKECSR